ncbi:signal peptidase II [Microbacterium oxydans]|uniref:signal peptidase II n=1 Tax=Microbacterium TaxID=33882 RepID=UPI00079A92FC|nr:MULTISPECIES: signal peptidase II [Microbacterium]RBO74059.1 signal peptidase II [Microbacterium sp. H6]KAB1891482.1 signal peptidase II [Microbacterium oxydans]KTR75140.1 signal peptidase [Microbacterium oxydans]MBE7954930.1 signal peptidase II [Microbacterium sp. R1]NYF29971.1 signal peptidase II [Microbacterium sp. JAI119]
MSGRRPLPRSAAGAIVAILAALVLAADQFVKYLTIENLPYQEPVPVLGEFLQLYYVRNPGAAFSLGSEVTWIFTIALAVVAGVIVWKAFGLKSRLWAVVLGCLLGGVLGNLSDRLFREPGFPMGHVVDMISMPWMMPAIFNVADVFIVTGMISVALLVVVGLRFDGTRERDHQLVQTEAEAEAAAAVEATDTDDDMVDAADAAPLRKVDDDTPSEGAAPAAEGR